MNKIYILILNVICLLVANEPIAVFSKVKGKVNHKLDSEVRLNSNMSKNTPLYLNSQINTKKQAFTKIIYLDDASSISIFPKTKVSFGGSISKRVINKQINIDHGIIFLNTNQLSNSQIKVSTKSSEINCNQCNLWILSTKSNGDSFILEEGIAELYNSSINSTILLSIDSTVISKKDEDYEINLRSETQKKFLESLMIDADEKLISERILKKKQVKEEKSTNIVVIQFVNAANSKKKLIFSYSKVDVETAK